MKRLACYHLFNDYSGSPKVLRSVLEGLLGLGYEVDLYTSRGGALDEIASTALRHHPYSYSFAGNGITTMLRYARVQMRYFFTAFGRIGRQSDAFYINTILPVGAALAARLMGKKVVYHYHENAFAKGTFYKMLARMMQILANDIICVSKSQAACLKDSNKIHIVPNALPAEFKSRLQPHIEQAFGHKNVLFLGSLKGYKGYREFIRLARELPQFKFTMVMNEEREALHAALAKEDIPANLKVHPRQDDVTPYYNHASLVLNLSDKRLFVETFGLTALEAMTAALPVIVPTEGGIAEMVVDGENGYKIDVTDFGEIKEKVIKILTDRALYSKLAKGTLQKSAEYSQERMVRAIAQIISSERTYL